MSCVDRLAPHWAGHIFGTNTGRLHLSLDPAKAGAERRSGKLRVSDDQLGTSSYEIEVAFDDDALVLVGTPSEEIEGIKQGAIAAKATFDPRGCLHGEWSSAIGTGGPFDLYPHLGTWQLGATAKLEQIYTSSRDLGALRLFRTDIEEIIATMRRKFPGSRIIVTHIDRGAELALYDDEFEARLEKLEKLDWIKLSVQAPADGGFTRSLTIDLGQSFNRVTTQGPEEAWVLGEIEASASALGRRQHRLSTAIGKYKLNINQLIFIAALVAMPELPLQERSLFIAGVLVLLFSANKIADILVPNFSVNFQIDRPSWFGGIWPSALSWLISATSGVAASFLFEWLKN